jgi:hypothetical protein
MIGSASGANGMIASSRLRNSGVEHAANLAHLVAALARVGEADGRLVEHFGSGVGGHDQHHVAEIRLAAVGIGQRAVVHHLQQDVKISG